MDDLESRLLAIDASVPAGLIPRALATAGARPSAGLSRWAFPRLNLATAVALLLPVLLAGGIAADLSGARQQSGRHGKVAPAGSPSAGPTPETPEPEGTPSPVPAADLRSAQLENAAGEVTAFRIKASADGAGMTLIGAWADFRRTVVFIHAPGKDYASGFIHGEIFSQAGWANSGYSYGYIRETGDLVLQFSSGLPSSAGGTADLIVDLDQEAPLPSLSPGGSWSGSLANHHLATFRAPVPVRGSQLPKPAPAQVAGWRFSFNSVSLTPGVIDVEVLEQGGPYGLKGDPPPDNLYSLTGGWKDPMLTLTGPDGRVIRPIGTNALLTDIRPFSEFHTIQPYNQIPVLINGWWPRGARGVYHLRCVIPGHTWDRYLTIP